MRSFSFVLFVSAGVRRFCLFLITSLGLVNLAFVAPFIAAAYFFYGHYSILWSAFWFVNVVAVNAQAP